MANADTVKIANAVQGVSATSTKNNERTTTDVFIGRAHNYPVRSAIHTVRTTPFLKNPNRVENKTKIDIKKAAGTNQKTKANKLST